VAAGVELLYAGMYDFTAGPDAPVLRPPAERRSALMAIPRVRALRTAAALRARSRAEVSDSTWAVHSRDEVDERILAWLRSLAAGPPFSWAVWTRTFLSAFELWHAGTRGEVDSALVGPVRRYLARHHAPPGARAAVEFRVALGRRDWSAARDAARLLEAEVKAGFEWVEPDPLREGATIAWLALGQRDSATQSFENLAPVARRSPDDLRVRLLRSYLEPDLQKP
jgi:hypothetical protein